MSKDYRNKEVLLEDCSSKIQGYLREVNEKMEESPIGARFYLRKAQETAEKEGSYGELNLHFQELAAIIGVHEERILANAYLIARDRPNAKRHLERAELGAQNMGLYDHLASRFNSLRENISLGGLERATQGTA